MLTAAPRPASADSPLAGAGAALAIGVAGSLIASAIYDYATSDSGSGTTTTTTTETSTTTTTETTTTTTTTTTTANSTAAPDSGAVDKAPTPKGYSVTSGLVRRTGTDSKSYGVAVDNIHDSADVLTQGGNVLGLKFKVERKIKTVLKRKAGVIAPGSKMSLDLTLRDLYLSTRDIPRTQGQSKMTVTVAVNGKVLYTFNAGVEQGRKPTTSDKAAAPRILKNANDILAIGDFTKKLSYDLEPNRTSDEIVMTILSEGSGKRLVKAPTPLPAPTL